MSGDMTITPSTRPRIARIAPSTIVLSVKLHGSVPVGKRRVDVCGSSRENQVIARLAGGAVDSPNDFRKEFSVEIREQNAECARLAGDEASRACVGDVAEGSGNLSDSESGCFAHRTSTIENA